MNRFIKIVSVITMLIFLRTGFSLAAEQVYFYYTDPAGTPLAMSDTSGAVVWRSNYLPFGEETTGSSIVPNNKMFVGKEKDAESGLHYFGARYMDSAAGRFAATDPVGPVDPLTGEANQIILHDPQRLNAYAYGLNNPYKYVDSDGRFVIVIPLIYAALEFTAAEVGAAIFAGIAVGGSAAYLKAQKQGETTQNQGTSAQTNNEEGDSGQNQHGDKKKGNRAKQKKGAEKPASEKTAKDIAKQIERDISKEARRDFHDMKDGGDRTLQQLKNDAQSLYRAAGKTPPKWLQ